MRILLIRNSLAVMLLFVAVMAFGQKHDTSGNHAVAHAKNWVSHHTNPPKRKRHHYPKKAHKDKSTHHAAMHAENWVKHHVTPRHHKGG